MSLLTSMTRRTLARASTINSLPSTSSSPAGVTVLAESRRYASRRRAKARAARKKVGVERDEMGKPKPMKKERTPPLFTALPIEPLTKNPIFEVETRPEPRELKFPEFSSRTVTEKNLGEVLQFATTAEANEARKEYGLPKSVWKEFKLLPSPTTVVRGVTLTAAEVLAKVHKERKSSKETRIVFSGRPGAGKSHLLLQAVEWCLSNGWVVMYVPRAVNLVNSTTLYSYDPRTQTFLQPHAAYQIIHRARIVNAQIFKTLKMAKALVGDGMKSVPAGTTLYDLCDVAKEEVARAPLVLDTLMKELEGQTKSPVLLAVDDLQALFSRSAYRDPTFKPIATYHLSTPRLLLEFISGRRSFPNGAVLGALTSSDPMFPIGLELREMLDVEDVAIQPIVEEPYVKRSSVLKEYLEGVKSMEVPNQLSVKEAASVFEVWMKQRMLASKAHDELFMAKYVESGGNARDFVWKGLLHTLQT